MEIIPHGCMLLDPYIQRLCNIYSSSEWSCRRKHQCEHKTALATVQPSARPP